MAVFIDADNLNDATALDHVLTSLRSQADRVIYRRAYGRPESLKGIHAVLWKHGVRPVANLIVDKTTTDSALVIDAVEAVCTNDIDTVAICSGDADFVPLAIWLREKGCRVVCYSLANKLFANPDSFYDDVVVLEVIEPSSSIEQEKQVPMVAQIAVPSQTAIDVIAGESGTSGKAIPVVKATVVAGPSVTQILAILPELKTKVPVHLSLAAKKLRDAGALSKTGSSVLLFRRHPAQFELTPKEQPNSVRYRG
ncbi:NYN domain-containing protein [Variovorax sp. RHLX14]|uniref:NYN domain-containing protein n=1 Tax=Variovorax sp. RHLX14 TaxID=1259731 RepID=UPI003F449733